jgi:hypothetical protein
MTGIAIQATAVLFPSRIRPIRLGEDHPLPFTSNALVSELRLSVLRTLLDSPKHRHKQGVFIYFYNLFDRKDLAVNINFFNFFYKLLLIQRLIFIIISFYLYNNLLNTAIWLD